MKSAAVLPANAAAGTHDHGTNARRLWIGSITAAARFATPSKAQGASLEHHADGPPGKILEGDVALSAIEVIEAPEHTAVVHPQLRVAWGADEIAQQGTAAQGAWGSAAGDVGSIRNKPGVFASANAEPERGANPGPRASGHFDLPVAESATARLSFMDNHAASGGREPVLDPRNGAAPSFPPDSGR